MPLWNDEDESISKDSALDWGSVPGAVSNRNNSLGSVSGVTKEKQSNMGADRGHVSRYDPSAMNRITDITDLVDDSSSDSDDDTIVGKRVGKKSATAAKQKDGEGHRPPMPLCRQAVVLLSLIAVIAAFGFGMFGIVNAVISSEPRNKPSNRSAERGEKVAGLEQQELLKIAQRVVTACSEEKLDLDMSECQKLCHSSMCCFDGGDYSCEEDESKDCAVYAGCEALVQGVPLDGADEDEE
eukprot:CAMPEP_0172554800 /NCGR_PEP_ID=MMETSP1067-20121228/56520_1 /TAXON_ID=265564 ORGANISM="Thalassiosira punctigera, Strain Tpunct2005C2" /NCGR_SAMPLE_ID=MMETSP1067 /ASSEMBLY_ACC=CAM_ASM_000444 /LENGTH=239 /DNA_ID=CAMNT_0013343241 /DNA_START=72 /DNA_END=791 /DNA_ORIENTATION=-